MQITFLDESYQLRRYDIFVVGAVVCGGPALNHIEEAFAEISSRATSYGVHPLAELHAIDLFHATNGWEALKGHPEEQIDIFSAIFDTIENSGATVFASSTAPSKLNLADPHDICLRYGLERVDRFLAAAGNYTVLIADDLSSRFERNREVTRCRRSGTGGWTPRQLERILDVVHFADSKQSRGLQAADFVAFIYRRLRMDDEKRDPREVDAVRKIWSRLSAPVTRDWAPQA